MARPLNPRPRYTPRLVLRPFRRKDVDATDAAVTVSLPELQKWLPWAQPDYTKSVTQRFIRDSIQAWNEGRAFDFAIRGRDDPDLHLGNVSIWYTSQQNLVGEIGYWVRSDHSGIGICTEATAMAMRIGFEELMMHKVVLRIAVGNRGSERVAEKLGFLCEGTLRDEVRVGRRWLDHTVWSLLSSEWEGERKRYTLEGWA